MDLGLDETSKETIEKRSGHNESDRGEFDRQTRIDSLQALRAWAFLGIFLTHAEFFVSWPTLGVSIFFVMSGFLMTYRYEKVEMEVSLKNNIFFSLKKIKKLYPLHLITMFFAIVASVVMMLQKGLRLKSIIWLGGEIVLNLTLLQTWVPYNGINVSLNGVAWYLSVTLFLYFMFPWIKRIIERKSIVKLCIICGIILFTEVVSCIPFITIFGNNSHVYLWFMYCFPVFRLGDFFIGCVLKRIFFESNVRNIEEIKATFFEVLAVVITVLVLICFNQEHSDVMLIALNNWTTIFVSVKSLALDS